VWTVSAHAAAPSTCTVVFTGARASVTCAGPAGAVSVAPAPRGVAVSGKNVQLKDRGCVAMPRAKAVALHAGRETGGTAEVAMLRVCAAGPLLLACRVSRVKVAPSTNSSVALSVVAAGSLTLRDSAAEGVRGGTAVHLAAGGDIHVLNSTFDGNHAGNGSLGGGLAVVASVGTRLVSFQGSAFLGSVADAGGGAWVDLRAVQPGGRCVLAGANRFEGCSSTLDCQPREECYGISALHVNATSTAGVAVDVAGTAFFGGNLGGGLGVTMQGTTGGKVVVHGHASFVNTSSEYSSALYISFFYSVRGTATIEGNASFRGNTAGTEAVLLLATSSNNSMVTIGGNASFQGNTADSTYGGGAVYMDLDYSNNSMVTIGGNASFQGNTARLWGGAVYVSFLAELYTSTYSPTNNTATIGGNASFQGNTAEFLGGAVYIDGFLSTNSTAIIEGNASFRGNTAYYDGGAVFLSPGNIASTATIAGNASFLGNTANLGNGGAAYISFLSSGSTIGFTAHFGGTAHFANNSAGGKGGAVAIHSYSCSTNCSAIIAGSITFVGNTAEVGGGAYADITDGDAVQLNVEGAEFANNIANAFGGGLVVLAMRSTNASIRVEHSRFSGNTVERGSGGGLLAMAGPPTDNRNNSVVLHITNTTFTNNTVRSGTGGGLHVDGTARRALDCLAFDRLPVTYCATAHLHGTTFEGNSANLGGGSMRSQHNAT
jgi:hypothetical protein